MAENRPLAELRAQIPGGPWELLAFSVIAQGENKNVWIHRRICGDPPGPNCSRRVREALRGLRRKGLVYRRRRVDGYYTYLTREGKIVAALLGLGQCP